MIETQRGIVEQTQETIVSYYNEDNPCEFQAFTTDMQNQITQNPQVLSYTPEMLGVVLFEKVKFVDSLMWDSWQENGVLPSSWSEVSNTVEFHSSIQNFAIQMRNNYVNELIEALYSLFVIEEEQLV